MVIELEKLIRKAEKKKNEMILSRVATYAEISLIVDIINYLKNKAGEENSPTPTAKWVHHSSGDEKRPPWFCSRCNWNDRIGSYETKYYKFCPNCSAPMIQDFEEEYYEN